MKKTISLLLSLTLIIISVPYFNAINTYGSFYYEENEDGTVTVTSFNDRTAANADIPSQIDGKTVTAIGSNAFKNRSALREVSVPDTVTKIGSFAFYGCHKLNSVVLGNGEKTLESRAFSLCDSLTYINLKSVKEIGEYCFYGCTSLQYTDFGDNLTKISDRAFYNCSSLIDALFPASLEIIGEYTFYGCKSITYLIFPDSLRYIGNSAFCSNEALKSVKFGNGELQISGYAFENCPLLTSLDFPKTITKIGRNAFSGRDETTVTYNNYEIKCYSHSAGYGYSFEIDAKPFVNDLGKKITPGDIDGKDGVKIEDARRCLRAAAEIEPFLTDEEFKTADVNGNNITDTEDALKIFKRALGIYKA